MRSAILCVLSMLAFIVLLLNSAQGAVGKKHDNSIGNIMYFDNPFTYKAGAVTAVAYVSEGKGLVVRMQPIGTYSLFTEDLLICDVPVEKFQNMSNPMVLTYRTQAHRIVEGIGCHELISVDSLKPKEVPQ